MRSEVLVRADNSAAVFVGHKACATRMTTEFVCKPFREMVQAVAPTEFDCLRAITTLLDMTKPRRLMRNENQHDLPLEKPSYVPFVREDETPIEIDRVYVTALPTSPRTGIVRLCARNYSQAFVISTTLMHELCEGLVREGLKIEERAKRGA
jgi:hypothetical protein